MRVGKLTWPSLNANRSRISNHFINLWSETRKMPQSKFSASTSLTETKPRGWHTRIFAPMWHENPGALCHPMPKDTSSMSQACLAKLTRPENNGANFNGNNNKKIVVTFNFQKKRVNVRGSTGTCYHILSAPIKIGDNISEHRHIIWDR